MRVQCGFFGVTTTRPQLAGRFHTGGAVTLDHRTPPPAEPYLLGWGAGGLDHSPSMSRTDRGRVGDTGATVAPDTGTGATTLPPPPATSRRTVPDHPDPVRPRTMR